MSESPWIFEAAPENFEALVLDNSEKGPILVNFWAPWAGPCLKLWPVLSGLAAEYGGRFLLVTLNTDTHKALARDLGVNSLPTVRVYRHRKVVDEVHGAESERQFRVLVDRHIARPSDAVLAAAVQAWNDGDHTRAGALLTDAAAQDRDNPRIPLVHAKLLTRNNALEAACALLRALPETLHADPQIRTLLVHIELLLEAQNAPPLAELEHAVEQHPDDPHTHFRLGAVRLAHDDYAGAMDALLQVVRCDRGFRDDIGRRGLMALFELPGERNELVRRYRAALLDALE